MVFEKTELGTEWPGRDGRRKGKATGLDAVGGSAEAQGSVMSDTCNDRYGIRLLNLTGK
jgi:hypothetical protein